MPPAMSLGSIQAQKKRCSIRGLLAADLAVMLAQQLVAATGPLARLLAECARRVQALRERYRTIAAATPEAHATTLLREWLSPQQCAQFDAEGYFDVVHRFMTDTGNIHLDRQVTSTTTIMALSAGATDS